MADAPPARRSGGWSWGSPGMKEYLTVGGIALAVFVAYFWWKNRQASTAAAANQATNSSAPSSAASGSPQGPSPTGISLTQFLSAMTNQSSSASSSSAPGTVITTAPPAAPPPGAKPPASPPGQTQKYVYVTVVPFANPAPWNSTLWGIATHYNVAGGAKTLAQLNNIKDENLIYPGQVIKVPVS